MPLRTARPALILLALAALVPALGGCGGDGGGSGSGSASGPAATTAAPPPEFAWLRPQPAPRGWPALSTAQGSKLPHPLTWKTVPGDADTTTAIKIRGGADIGYLTIAPAVPGMTPQAWLKVVTGDRRRRGLRKLTVIAQADGLRFNNGTGACVEDRYTKRTGTTYHEIACLVRGPKGNVTVFGSAPPATWPAQRATIQRAIASMTP